MAGGSAHGAADEAREAARHVSGAPRVVCVTDRSTNYWAVVAGSTRLLVDLGWPGRHRALAAALARAGVAPTHGFATHWHPDHAGAAEELRRAGMTLVCFDEQRDAAPALARLVKPADGWLSPDFAAASWMPCAAGRAWLGALGIDGVVVHTPGHSADSVSLVLADGRCFTGDLTWPDLIGNEDPAVVAASWQALREAGARVVHPGHGPVRALP